jgi:hypothetical protein
LLNVPAATVAVPQGGPESPAERDRIVAFGSGHPGGANFTFAVGELTPEGELLTTQGLGFRSVLIGGLKIRST